MNTKNHTYKQIITRVLSGEASAADKERLNLWLARSEEHQRIYAQYRKIWELEPEAQLDVEFDTQQALQNVLNMIESGKPGETGGAQEKDEAAKQARIQTGRKFFINRKQNMQWVFGVAAAFLFLIATSLFFFLRSPQAEMLALVADQGDTLFTLDDGSQVHLRAGGSLHYTTAFNDKKRPVRLDGSAFFEVEKDERRPFVITTEHATIEVLGTSFFVETKDDQLSVYVSEGSVRLKSNQKNGPGAIISKGHSGTLVYDQQNIVVSSLENMNFLAWKTGRLQFDNEPLTEVFMALEEIYKISVNAPEEVMNLRLTARFQDETPETILKSISIVFGFDVTQNQDEYVIRPENQDINRKGLEQH